MAKKYWWQKVPNPDAIVQAARRPVSDKRVRYSTALKHAGLFKDEPEVIRGLMNADVPLALSMRAFNPYRAAKEQAISKTMADAGFGKKQQEPKVSDVELAQRRVNEIKNDMEGGGFWGAVGDVGSAIGGAFKAVGEGIATGANAVWQTLTLPLTAGYANENEFDRFLGPANEQLSKNPLLGAAAGIATGALNYGEGAARLATGDLTPQQQQDIRAGGGNPEQLGDRLSFYYQDFGEKRTPVSDADVKWLKNLGMYTPEDVDAAREIVTSGALEDLTRSMPALSQRAQDLVLRANSDKKAGDLLNAMADTTQTAFGGRLIRQAAPDQAPGEWFGPGSVSRGIAAGIAELIATWHLDPAVLVGKGITAARNARYTIRFDTAESIDNTIQMLKASDDAFKPQGAHATRFEQAMQTADDIVQAQAKGVDGRIEAAKLRESWVRRFPGYDKTLDILVGMRAGNVGKVRVRDEVSALKDAKEATATGAGLRQWVLETSGDGTPLWRFTWDDGTKLTQEERARERARVADELSGFILADAFASGRELTGSRLLLPGQLSVNGKIRDTIAPVLEAFGRRDRSVMKQLKEVGTKPINLTSHLSTDEVGRWDMFTGADSAEWYRNNYTFGMSHFFARAWRNFERTFSNKVIVPASPDSVKVFGELVSQFMPKRQAQMVTTQYAAANPAERWVMTRQTIGSLLNVMRLRDTEASQKIVERLTKGLIPTDDFIQGYKVGAHEHYTTPDMNDIRVGDLKMPAAVHPWQVAEGIQLPNWRELRQLADRTKLLNMVHARVDGDTANAMVRIWKGAKVTTWSNLLRQVLEGFALTAWRDPEVFKEIRGARKAVKAAVLTGRADIRDVKRLVGKTNKLNADDLQALERIRTSEPEKFVSTMQGLLTKNGFDPGAAEVLARMGDHVDIAEFWGSLKIKGPISPTWLAVMGPWDTLRRVRAERLRGKGGEVADTPMERYLDGELVHEMTQAAARQLGYSAESHVWNTAERGNISNRQLVLDAAGRGITMRPVKVSNAYEWATDINPALWAAELGRRLNDPTGLFTSQVIAHHAIAGKAIRAKAQEAGVLPPDVNAIAAAQLRDFANQWQVAPQTLRDPDTLMAHLYMEHVWGSKMRTDAARMQHLPDGTFAVNPADREIAGLHTARAAVDDLVYHLGGKVNRAESGAIINIDFPEEMDGILRKVARGEAIGAEDLRKLPDEVRPEGLVAPIYAPMTPAGQGPIQGLANLAARAYSAVVAQPMENLYMIPAFLARKRVAYGEVQPFLEALMKRGMQREHAAYLVEAMVTNRAIARTFNTTDNPAERTVFAEMGDKWLMFNRANLDFLRRIIHAGVASPEGIARANILVNAGVHTGIMHAEPFQDEEGNTEQRLTFTYPGSELAQRVFADAGVALGLYPDELTKVPQFDGFKSQVRFLNPGVSNPVGFSLNPIFGHSVDVISWLWPSATVDMERLKRAFSGGQDFEGTEPAVSLKNLMPSMFSRFVPLMQHGDVDGQLQSAIRAAMMYAELSGHAPDSNASPAERDRFMQEVKTTAVNIMIQRALFGAFLPATPMINDPQEIEVDTLGRLQGLPSLRSEFFDIRSELAKKYPDNFIRANSEAVAEFARRYPGELIVNPAAFSVGSTKIAGSETFVPYTIEATRWLITNKDFVKANPTVALALMPASTADGDFSNEAYKLQLKHDVRTHKDLAEFYTDLTLSDDIGEYYKTRSTFFAAMNQDPVAKKLISAKLDNWEDVWRRTHPLAVQELNRRSNPDYVHAEVAPALDRIVNNVDALPQSMHGFKPQIQEMYEDYTDYRKRYMDVPFYDNTGRSNTNKAYQSRGDAKWIGTPLEKLWDLMRVQEGR